MDADRWHSVELSNEQLTNNEHQQIQALFERLLITTGSPASVAMFSATNADGATVLYFSPGTSDVVIRVARAKPSAAAPRHATLCVGQQVALKRLRDGTL